MENYGLAGPLGAEFSDCGKYRYLLWRVWSDTFPPLGVIMLNPSTADAVDDDPTITRMINRARRLQRGGIIVGNIYSFRATDPENMKAADDPIGLHNDAHLRMIGTLCDTVFLGWGTHGERIREKAVIDMLRALPRPPRLIHLGLTKDGSPKHPLYITYDEKKAPYQELA